MWELGGGPVEAEMITSLQSEQFVIVISVAPVDVLIEVYNEVISSS